MDLIIYSDKFRRWPQNLQNPTGIQYGGLAGGFLESSKLTMALSNSAIRQGCNWIPKDWGKKAGFVGRFNGKLTKDTQGSMQSLLVELFIEPRLQWQQGTQGRQQRRRRRRRRQQQQQPPPPPQQQQQHHDDDNNDNSHNKYQNTLKATSWAKCSNRRQLK